MNTINQRLAEQVTLGADRVPVDPDRAVEAAVDSPQTRLLLALSDDADLHAAWARAVDFEETDAIGRLGWVQAELERVDSGVDAALDGEEPGPMIETLARSGVAWRHPALVEALDDDELRPAAATVLARGAPGQLRAHLMESDVVEEVVDMLRAAALVGAGELWSAFLIWRGRLEDVVEEDEATGTEWLDRLDAIGAALEPTLFARGALSGEYGTDWFAEPTAVADFLQVYGPSDWLPVGARLQAADEVGAGMYGAVAVSAAQGIGAEPPDDEEVEDLLDLLAAAPDPNQKDAAWEGLASRLGFGFQLAVGEEELALLLAQVATHERLVTWGVHSPGIPGLPLSATGVDYIDADAAREVLETMAAGGEENVEERTVTAVRTVCDALDWVRRDVDEIDDLLWSVAGILGQVDAESVQTARSELESALAGGEDVQDVDALAVEAADEGALVGMDAVRRLGDRSDEPSQVALGQIWAGDGSVWRASFVEGVLRDSVALGVEVS